MVRFEPLADTTKNIYQSLVTLDAADVSILVDAGWDAALETSLANITKATPKIKLVLLTHASISHLGAYCYLCKTVPGFSSIPTYATIPVVNLGRVVVLDYYRSKGLVGPLLEPLMSVEELEGYFDKINTVKYSQQVTLPFIDNLELTAFCAGHTLGGTLWRISDAADEVLIALDWNHSRDGHLNSAFLESRGQVNEALKNPGVLITSSRVAESPSLKQVRSELLNSIDAVLSRNGTVLLPLDSTSRLLEVLLVVEKHMASQKSRVPLILASPSGQRVLELASGMLEWMVSTIIADWQVKNDSPFDMAKVECIKSLKDLRTYGDRPKIVIASGECLETGFARQIFVELASSAANAVILTQLQAAPKALGSTLYNIWRDANKPQPKLVALNCVLPKVRLVTETPLKGQKLAKYNQAKQELVRQAEIQSAIEKRNKEILEHEDKDDDQFDYSSDDGGNDELVKMDLGLFVYADGVHDFDMTKDKSERVRMFPTVHKRQKIDGYGEVLKPGEFERNLKEDLDIQPQPQEDLDTNWAKDEPLKSQKQNEEEPVELIAKETDVKAICSVNYIDFNGLTDLRSVSMILPQVQPTKVVVLPGDKRVVDALASSLNAVVGDVKLELERTNFSLDVEISAPLEERLVWQTISDGSSVAYVAGRLDLKDTSHAVLEPLDGTALKSQETILVGDVRLTELRAKVLEAGYKAEFRDRGMLVCNNNVSVRKLGEGRFVVEGGLDPEFYAVRDFVRSFLAAV